ncbi:hypothetical protein ACQ7B2_01125, partial [Escherichia coli]
AWRELADPQLVDDDEERLPLFPLGFTLDQRDRRLFAGLIPASSREAYGNTGPAAPAPDPADPTPPDPRAVVL